MYVRPPTITQYCHLNTSGDFEQYNTNIQNTSTVIRVTVIPRFENRVLEGLKHLKVINFRNDNIIFISGQDSEEALSIESLWKNYCNYNK